jgi:hypothetical protein|tara:strand:+ start:162 stop:323 length:162 start_codon:yes stop_codon:yes gene_type:complete
MENKLKYITLLILLWGVFLKTQHLEVFGITGGILITVGTLLASVYLIIKLFKK